MVYYQKLRAASQSESDWVLQASQSVLCCDNTYVVRRTHTISHDYLTAHLQQHLVHRISHPHSHHSLPDELLPSRPQLQNIRQGSRLPALRTIRDATNARWIEESDNA